MYSADLNNYPLIIELKSAVNWWRTRQPRHIDYQPSQVLIYKEEQRGTNVLLKKYPMVREGFEPGDPSIPSPEYSH